MPSFIRVFSVLCRFLQGSHEVQSPGLDQPRPKVKTLHKHGISAHTQYSQRHSKTNGIYVDGESAQQATKMAEGEEAEMRMPVGPRC